jgi:hypothetical protein
MFYSTVLHKHTTLGRSVKIFTNDLNVSLHANFLAPVPPIGKWGGGPMPCRHAFPTAQSASYRAMTETKTKLRGFGPRTNYTDRAAAACWRG